MTNILAEIAELSRKKICH